MSARLSKPKPLTEEMLRALRFMEARVDKSVYRHPGGYWSGPGNPGSFMSLFGTSTISSLVGRGLADYTRWQHGKSGDFPVRLTLRPGVIDTTKDVTLEASFQLPASSEPLTVQEDPDDE